MSGMTTEELDRLDSEAVELVKTSDNIGAVLVAGQIRRLIAEIRKRDKRVEELEKRLMIEVVPPDNMHIITDAQIDAAWDRAQKPLDTGRATFDDGLETLERLGIVQCPERECGGRGFIQHLETPLEPGDSCGWTQRCPTCHGHRWVVKDE